MPHPVTFLWPQLLWLLLALPLLAALYIWLLRRKKTLALRYASLTIVKEAMGTGQRVRRQRRVHVQPERRRHHFGHGHEITVDVEREVRHKCRIDAEVAAGAEEECVAVARRLGDHLHAHDAIGARTIVDDDRLAQQFLQLG